MEARWGPFLVKLSRHAVERMRERRVAVEEVLSALECRVEEAYDAERDVNLLLGCNGVAVVYAQRGAVIEVVTVMREREYRFLVHHVGRRRYRVVA